MGFEEICVPHNLPVTDDEILRAIASRSNKSTLGIDQITANMLQHLHLNSITYYTSLLNRILFSDIYLFVWKIALVIPLLKPPKDPTHPLSYRPISHLNVLSKILGKIIRNRLTWFLKTNEILSNSQFGCRRKRSTLKALADQDTQIHEAHANGSSLFSVFFDMENAFPRVWTYPYVRSSKT